MLESGGGEGWRETGLAEFAERSLSLSGKKRIMKATSQPRVRTRIGMVRRKAYWLSRRGGVARFAVTIWWVKALCQRRKAAAYQRVMVRK